MEKFLSVLSSFAAALIVVGAIVLPFYVHSRQSKSNERFYEIENKVDSLENVITKMQEVDTLSLNICETNSKNIEAIEQGQVDIKKRITNLEWWTKELDEELNEFD